MSDRIAVTLNGSRTELAADTPLTALLDDLGVPAPRRGVAVAVDGEVVPRAEWDRRRLDDGARVEVVHAIQGG